MLHRILSALFLTLACAITLEAQTGGAIVEIRAGHNTAYGGFGAFSLETRHDFRQVFSIGGGIQYNTIGKVAIELCPSFFHKMPWGRISVEIPLHYSKISATDILSGGAGMALTSRWIDCRGGYFFRTFGLKGSRIDEWFNIYYKFAVNCLPMIDRWDLQIYMTNCESFELERHYQPSFVAQGWYYPSDKMGISLGLCYKPAGMFHLSADYHQVYTKAGICYRW